MTDDKPMIDLNRSAELGDWIAAVVVCADGTEMLWLVTRDPSGDNGCCCAQCAPHEQVADDAVTRR